MVKTSALTVLLAGATLLAACDTIAPYSLQAYTNDTTLKADVAALVDKSTTPYASHAAEIDALTLKLHEAYEFSKGEALNGLSNREWDTLLATDGALYGKFLKRWHDRQQLSACAAANWKVLLDRAFDTMICLEANKQSASNCPAPEALPTCTPDMEETTP